MIIELEWRIPWDSSVKHEHRIKAAEKLVTYFNQGKVFEVDKRWQATATVHGDGIDPFLRIRLES